MIYYAEERSERRYAVKGQGNVNATKIGLTENQAHTLAHHLAGHDGYVKWKGLNGKFEHCPCARCKKNR
jgi:hypothetical protein